MRHAQERLATVTAQRVLAVDEPQPVRGGPLSNSSREVAAIVDHFDQRTILAHEQATRPAVLAALAAGVDVAHFSCHGGNNWGQPLETALSMANYTLLTVRDLLELRLPGARLASLSACETGLVGTQLPDEVVMLPSALLQAGFAGVAASLWSVADVSTAMLMARFYDLWQGAGVAPVQALRQAQQWVRDTTNQEKADYFAIHVPEWQPSGATKMAAGVAAEFFNEMELRKDGSAARTFAHPFWWAAFTFTGV